MMPKTPLLLLQYRTTPHDVTGRAPCERLLGRMVKTPLDVLHPDLQSTVLFKQQKLTADQGCRPGPLPELEAPVFTRNFRPGPPWPTLVRRTGGVSCQPASASSLLVQMPDGAGPHSTDTPTMLGLASGPDQHSRLPLPAEHRPPLRPQALPVVRHLLGRCRTRQHSPVQPLQTLQMGRGCLRQHLASPHSARQHPCPGGVLGGGGHRTVTRLGNRHRRPG
ncbi:uncharacterized protein LOC142567823 isoform X2 [Dermacentor variabilis]|uniref:uncharacterized protein LOC142567823 isoform X2 n=1 Tax=Dermacentor variabilis TaxID=34621 RepID=UPI003F5C13F1